MAGHGKAAGSLVGAAPRTRESGQWKGRSFIRGGRAGPRRMRYIAALSAIRDNPDMARKYRDARSRQAGQGRPDRGHAQAGGAGQRAAETGPTVDPRARPRLKGSRALASGAGGSGAVSNRPCSHAAVRVFEHRRGLPEQRTSREWPWTENPPSTTRILTGQGSSLRDSIGHRMVQDDRFPEPFEGNEHEACDEVPVHTYGHRLGVPCVRGDE